MREHWERGPRFRDLRWRAVFWFNVARQASLSWSLRRWSYPKAQIHKQTDSIFPAFSRVALGSARSPLRSFSVKPRVIVQPTSLLSHRRRCCTHEFRSPRASEQFTDAQSLLFFLPQFTGAIVVAFLLFFARSSSARIRARCDPVSNRSRGKVQSGEKEDREDALSLGHMDNGGSRQGE